MVGVAAIDRAQLDDEHQHNASGQRPSYPSRTCQAAHAAGAPETENGQALDRGGKLQTIGQDCIETWYVEPRGGHRHNRLDFIYVDA